MTVLWFRLAHAHPDSGKSASRFCRNRYIATLTTQAEWFSLRRTEIRVFIFQAEIIADKNA